MWKYGDAVSAEDVLKAIEYTESLFEKYGAVPTDLNAENRQKYNYRITYCYKERFYRVDVIYYDHKPFIVFESIDDIESAKAGVMEDGDIFPFDLPPDKIEKEVRYLFEIEPYPANYPDR